MPPRSTPDRPSGPRWRRRPGRRADEILDAALTVFGEVGFARARVEAVADRAGVSKGTLYRYFESKETLFREVVRARLGRAVADLEREVEEPTGSARELLVRLVRRTFEPARRPEAIRTRQVVQAELGSLPELARMYCDEVVLRPRRHFEHVIERGLASGEFRRAAHGYAARALLGLVVHAALLQGVCSRLDPDPLGDEAALDGLIDFCLGGVLARPSFCSP